MADEQVVSVKDFGHVVESLISLTEELIDLRKQFNLMASEFLGRLNDYHGRSEQQLIEARNLLSTTMAKITTETLAESLTQPGIVLVTRPATSAEIRNGEAIAVRVVK